MTISDGYRAENQRLHDMRGYGTSGHLWLGNIVELARLVNARSLLDYGCGKATLESYVEPHGLAYTGYDPVTRPKKPKKGTYDLVACLDVLEHIEPEYLDDVLDELTGYTGKLFFAVVSTRAAGKTLSDGRNAHLIQEPWEWWKPVLTTSTRWRCLRIRQHADHFDFVGCARTRQVDKKTALKLRGQL